METTTPTYSVELHEQCVYRVDVVATSAVEAIQKVEAFYDQQRTPQIKYQEEGLTAILRHGFAGVFGTPVAVTASAYSAELHERYVYDLKVTATSAVEVREKVKAFYAWQRKPRSKYQEEGLTATLQVNSVCHSRPTASRSAQAKARAAARYSQRDAVLAA